MVIRARTRLSQITVIEHLIRLGEGVRGKMGALSPQSICG
jgi:hypothetical protein